MESNPLHDKTNYQGRKLALLLVAIGVPALFYYLRLAMAFAATRAGAGSSAFLLLMRGSTAALVLFFVTQFAAACYLRRLFRRPRSSLARGLQIAGIAVACGAISIGAAILIESFALEIVIRTRSY
ncbi:MAG TPA: hypothetical protein VHZ07_27390 [Bryobacteraceae bacterium]|jgi:hypothetical protein|nr:hypothetical protein [Bryobacteraceae bacterium]